MELKEQGFRKSRPFAPLYAWGKDSMGRGEALWFSIGPGLAFVICVMIIALHDGNRPFNVLLLLASGILFGFVLFQALLTLRFMLWEPIVSTALLLAAQAWHVFRPEPHEKFLPLFVIVTIVAMASMERIFRRARGSRMRATT